MTNKEKFADFIKNVHEKIEELEEKRTSIYKEIKTLEKRKNSWFMDGFNKALVYIFGDDEINKDRYEEYSKYLSNVIKKLKNILDETGREIEELKRHDDNLFQEGFIAALEMYSPNDDENETSLNETEVKEQKEIEECNEEQESEVDCDIKNNSLNKECSFVTFLYKAFKFPESDDEDVNNDLKKIIKFMGVNKYCDKLTNGGKSVIKFLTSNAGDFNADYYVNQFNCTRELLLASVQNAKSEIYYITDGCFDIVYMSKDNESDFKYLIDDNDISRFDTKDIYVKLIKVKDIDVKNMRPKWQKVASLVNEN